jgi:hypothetical protein
MGKTIDPRSFLKLGAPSAGAAICREIDGKAVEAHDLLSWKKA